MKFSLLCFLSLFLTISFIFAQPAQSPWCDEPFLQDLAQKYSANKNIQLIQVRSDRNGRIIVLSDKGLLEPFKDKLVKETLHRPLNDLNILAIESYQNQVVYLTDKAVLSNAWAGKIFIDTGMPLATHFVLGPDFELLVSSPDGFKHFAEKAYQSKISAIIALKHDPQRNHYLLLTETKLWRYQVNQKPEVVVEGDNLTCLEIADTELLIGTTDGYWKIDAASFEKKQLLRKLPWTDITCLRVIDHKIWFGTPRGAFCIDKNNEISYYASKRWLVDDSVVDLAPGPGNSVLVLTKTGLSQIKFKSMTLATKAEHFDRLTRQRHIRYGLNSKLILEKTGDLSTGVLVDQDNDGLWTAMYLGGELFRFQVTRSEDALQNCYESFEAMERLYTLNHIPGFPARAFERRGYKESDRERWRPSADKNWDWKATTSSDEIVGHFFVLSLFAEFIENPAWKNRAIKLMDECMDHIVRNNWYLIDYDGKPTQWGRWHPEYVNQFPKEVGDRRLNSVEIIAFLQTAYHFTGKEIYKEKAYQLFTEHGYLENIMIPITRIGFVPGMDLSTDWNHSDDELAFLSYWNLYRYAFHDSLKDKYRETIRGHWELEKPEKNSLWAFIAASTGITPVDLEAAIWTLQKLPLDFIGWTILNSHRKDLEFLPENFRRQTITQVLPPGERVLSKYNGNAFRLDGGEGGRREYSGDIYTLPYWMGRYVGLIK